MKSNSMYEAVLQELSKEYGMLMIKYIPRLHEASHEDKKGVKLSHAELVRRIQEDCIRVCAENTERIKFSEASEEEVIEEILEYNHDEADIEHMVTVENIDLFSHLDSLKENCIKRTDPEWFLFGIHEQFQNGKINPGPLGSMRTQFCKCCGEPIYFPTNGRNGQDNAFKNINKAV
jgi:hypothetical protein